MIIKMEAEYEQFLAVTERLTFKKEQTPKESALYDLVTMLIETYEIQHYPIEKSSPVEVLQHIIESSGISSINLAKIFGSSETLNRVLTGQELISVNQADALADRFKLPPHVFLNQLSDLSPDLSERSIRKQAIDDYLNQRHS
jgi:HTH-type transcriptional regulator / antitoxin HigA